MCSPPPGGLVLDTHPPGFTYPSDTNEVGPGLFLSVDYTSPGAIETFSSAGRCAGATRPPDARAGPAVARAAASQRRHPRQRRQERPRDRRRPPHEQDRLAIRPHSYPGHRRRLPQQSRRRRPGATVLARGAVRQKLARALRYRAVTRWTRRGAVPARRSRTARRSSCDRPRSLSVPEQRSPRCPTAPAADVRRA